MQVFRVFLVLLMSMTAVLSSDCIDMRNCNDCVNKRTWNPFANCRWCPLDRLCHTYGAIATNPCVSDLSIKYESECPAESDVYGTYDEQLAHEQMFISAIAYTDKVTECLSDINSARSDVSLDFNMVSLIAIKCDDSLFDYEECAVVVALSHSRKSILVSFRGTAEDLQLVDEIISILHEPTVDFGNGHVQVYFLDAFNKLSPCLRNKIVDLKQQYPDYMVRFSGHSLGGALASIAAFSYIQDGTVTKNDATLYTYGMPRVGDKLYAVDHDLTVNNSFRVVNYRDCVPHFPTCIGFCTTEEETGPYHHRTEVFYDTGNMQLGSAYKVCHSNEDESCSHKYQGFIDTPTNIGQCIDNHKSYFGVPVGTYCKELAYESRKKRSSTVSAIHHMLSEDQCSTFNI